MKILLKDALEKGCVLGDDYVARRRRVRKLAKEFGVLDKLEEWVLVLDCPGPVLLYTPYIGTTDFIQWINASRAGEGEKFYFNVPMDSPTTSLRLVRPAYSLDYKVVPKFFAVYGPVEN